jgi:hypothetical protein
VTVHREANEMLGRDWDADLDEGGQYFHFKADIIAMFADICSVESYRWAQTAVFS